jgi:hypothetical protein
LKSIFVFLFFASSYTAFGQIEWLEADTTKIEGLSYTLSYTSRRSIIEQKATSIRGVNAGIRFGENRNRLTLAYFWCNTDPNIKLIDFSNDRKQMVDLSGFLNKDFHYYNLMYYPYWLNTKKWRLSTPIELGVGKMTERGVSIFSQISPYSKDNYFIPLQFGGYMEYKAIRHFGINFELGYRYIVKEKNMSIPLNGVYYGIGLNVYLGTIWRDFKPFFKTKKQ